MLSYSVVGNSFAAPEAIVTSGLSTAVGSNNAIYNVQTLALGDYNGDGCREWSTATSCPNGQTCVGGACGQR